jgi:hypothetical protein
MTHAQRVLDLLSDGKPHQHHELYRLGVIAHSRVADLRKRGHNIVCWTERVRGETVSVYQLLPTLREAAPESGNKSPSLSAATRSVGLPPNTPPHDAGLPQSAPAGAGLTDTGCSWSGPLQLQLDAA